MRFTKSMYESMSNSNILDEILMKEDWFFLPISTNIPDNWDLDSELHRVNNIGTKSSESLESKDR